MYPVTHLPAPEGPWKGLFLPSTHVLSLSLLTTPAPAFLLAPWPHPFQPVPHWSTRFLCPGWLIPISRPVSCRPAYSSPWWWRQQGPLKRW
jgi:hypothetical protein